MVEILPIRRLVETRLRELGIRRSELARRLGYANVVKGMRRIEDVCQGAIAGSAASGILSGLPAALELFPDVVDKAVGETAEALAHRRSLAEPPFAPTAWLVGTESRPSQITIFGVSGGAKRWLQIPLELTRPPVTYAQQALEVVRKTPIVPFFGPTKGFVVNYKPDFAVRFDADGEPVERFDRAYRPGDVVLSLGSRPIAADVLSKMLGC